MKTEDSVILVSDLDEVIGEMEKYQAHRTGVLHRAISVYLLRRNQDGVAEILIQKRSEHKIVGAGEWANTACGNVRPGERYVDCAVRRLREELGIEVAESSLHPLLKFQYSVQCNQEFAEHEMDQVFVGWYHDSEPQLNSIEVSKTEWVDWNNFADKNWQDKIKKPWTPWFIIMMQNEELKKLVTTYVS